MKIGYRKPNIKKSIKARTTGKIKRKVKKSVNPFYGKKGMGYIKNPKKALKNKVYHKTTFGTSDIIKSATQPKNNNTVTKSNYVMNKKGINPIAYACIVAFAGVFGVHRFIDGSIGMGLLYLFTCGLFGIGWLFDLVKAIILITKGNN